VSFDTLRCVLCGSGLVLTQGVDEDGITWTRQRCSCGRTDFLHIDQGELDLIGVRDGAAYPASDFEIVDP
jgi:hypothetical protein